MSHPNRIAVPYRLGSSSSHVAVDLVMLTMIDGELHVAMFEREEEPFAGFFVLPGKRVGMSRDLRDVMFELLSEHIGDIDVIPEGTVKATAPGWLM